METSNYNVKRDETTSVFFNKKLRYFISSKNCNAFFSIILLQISSDNLR
jgi:hypothetical protein